MPLLTLLFAIAFSAAPFFVPFDGFDPDLYPVPQDDPPVQPAGWAFAIWGPIYLWLVASAAYGVWKRRDHPAWVAHRGPLCISLAVGVIWLSVAQVSPVWATVLIWVMLGTAIDAYLKSPDADLALARAPIGLYAGWLTAASSVSIGLLAAGYGLLGPVPAAYLALVIALTIGAVVQWARPSVTYPAAIAWALVGIAVQNAGLLPGLVMIASVSALILATWGARSLRT
ncbi:hypothetical protein ILP92_12510 [Maribius pontilimi]|uniref:TspO and MBR related proteins n=1 Tax=Palleronia pontilimi TaxID=1964209 RepID=A0A934IHP9_9RHOB|nr:hypothetical protein [Palleronia pontilimi]MBJ3763570.1 hypothetical protein [Palleronia pontilimi]